MRLLPIIALAAALLQPALASVTSPAEDLPALVDGNTEFALDMFGLLSAEASDGNLFFSPFSISSALGMTYAGARGGTEEQMADVLHFRLPHLSLHPCFHALLDRMDADYRAALADEDAEPLILEVANAIWVERSFRLLDDYVDIVVEQYGAEARNVDFINDPETQRLTINEWVSERTSNRIQDLLAPGTITGLTRVVLTNAIYFKGTWLSEFDEGVTREEDFTLLDGTIVRVPMMHQTHTFSAGRGPGCSAIRLPYSDALSSMLIILPDGDLSGFEEGLDRETLEAVFSSLCPVETVLSMPSFEFSTGFMLNDALISLGMTDAFDEALADFSGFTGGRDLFVSAVIHKAFVKVDETGTEAAAATAVVMNMTTSAQPHQPFVFRVDKPFLFLVMDDLTGSILFIGRVADPRA